jgi:hypothetical protein
MYQQPFTSSIGAWEHNEVFSLETVFIGQSDSREAQPWARGSWAPFRDATPGLGEQGLYGQSHPKQGCQGLEEEPALHQVCIYL